VRRGHPASAHRLLSSFPRLPWLRQWLLPQLYGLLPHLGEHPPAVPVAGDAERPFCCGAWLSCRAACCGDGGDSGDGGRSGLRRRRGGAVTLLGYFRLKEPNAGERGRERVPGGGHHMRGPSTCRCPALPRSPRSQAGGTASPQGKGS